MGIDIVDEEVPKGGSEAAPSASEDGLKEIEALRDAIKKADDDEIKRKAVEAINKQKADREAKKAEEKVEKLPKKEYPHPTLSAGSILHRDSQGNYLIVVNRDKFYKLCVHFIMRAQPGYAIANMRQIGELLGVTDFAEAQAEWEKIRDEVHRRIQYV